MHGARQALDFPSPPAQLSALCYFAASIFWRGSIYDWNSSSPVTLGPFEESFRVHLNEKGTRLTASLIRLPVVGQAASAVTGFPCRDLRSSYSSVRAFPRTIVTFASPPEEAIPLL